MDSLSGVRSADWYMGGTGRSRTRVAARPADSVPLLDVHVRPGWMASLPGRATDEVLADAPESLFGVVISEFARRFASFGIKAGGDAGHVLRRCQPHNGVGALRDRAARP